MLLCGKICEGPFWHDSNDPKVEGTPAMQAVSQFGGAGVPSIADTNKRTRQAMYV
jgi:hypothetical protein